MAYFVQTYLQQTVEQLSIYMDKIASLGHTSGDVDREYLTATGMFSALDESRTVADMTAEHRWPGRILKKETVISS